MSASYTDSSVIARFNIPAENLTTESRVEVRRNGDRYSVVVMEYDDRDHDGDRDPRSPASVDFVATCVSRIALKWPGLANLKHFMLRLTGINCPHHKAGYHSNWVFNVYNPMTAVAHIAIQDVDRPLLDARLVRIPPPVFTPTTQGCVNCWEDFNCPIIDDAGELIYKVRTNKPLDSVPIENYTRDDGSLVMKLGACGVQMFGFRPEDIELTGSVLDVFGLPAAPPKLTRQHAGILSIDDNFQTVPATPLAPPSPLLAPKPKMHGNHVIAPPVRKVQPAKQTKPVKKGTKRPLEVEAVAAPAPRRTEVLTQEAIDLTEETEGTSAENPIDVASGEE